MPNSTQKKEKHPNNSISFFDKGLAIVFIISKIITISLFLLFFYGYPEYHSIANLGNSFYSGQEILALFANWDGQFYLLIAEKGYNANAASHAFYPLYPNDG